MSTTALAITGVSTTALAITGVKAVIEGLGDFEGGMKEMTGLVAGFGKKAAASAREFKPFQNIINAVTESLKRIAEFVIAGIILRGIEAIVGALRDMIGSVIEAGMEFQNLTVRLETFVAGDILEAGQVNNFTEALELAGPKAEELFGWIQKIALQTPFDIGDVADAMTMARAWGFGADEAKRLTEQVIDFTAGMGFSSEEMDRVIKALGQMKSLGRVAGQELLQLANAGVPVADIMENIRLELGLTTKEFEKLRKKGGVSAEMFFEQWDELVSTKFEGSAKRMSRTMSGVIGNIKDLIEGVLGFNIVRPVLDVVATSLASIIDALTTGDRGARLLEITKKIGESLSGIAGLFFFEGLEGLTGGPTDIADKILGILDKVKAKLQGIKRILELDAGPGEKASAILIFLGVSEDTVAKINDFVERAKEIFNDLRNAITGETPEGEEESPIAKFFGSIRRAVENFKTFWEENKEGILGAFSDIFEGVFGVGEMTGESILEIIGGAIEDLSEKAIENGPTIVEKLQEISDFINDDFMPAWERVTQWIENNQDKLLALAGVIGGIGLVLKLIAPILFFVALFLLPKFIEFLIDLGEKVSNTRDRLEELDTTIKTKVVEALETFKTKIDELVQKIRDKLGIHEMNSIARDAIQGLVDGFITGILNAWQSVMPWLSWFIDQVRRVLGISSPSKLFAEFGQNINEGLAQGIIDSIQLPAAAMDATVQHVVSAGSSAMMGGATTNNTVNNNMTMNVHTQARTSTVMADTRTMQAIVGAT
jgi:tape measure domain-containing protein